MSWDLLEASDGGFYINRAGIHRVISQYVRAQSKCDSARMVTHTDRYMHLFALPTTYSVEIDDERIRLDDQVGTPVLEEMFYGNLAQGQSMRGAREQLLAWMWATYQYEQSLLSKIRSAQYQTMASIDEKVSKAKHFEEGAKMVRDLSAMALLVGATFVTGGAAAEGAVGVSTMTGGELLGTSTMYAGMKGVFKYQDTGKAEDAIFTGTASFVTGIVGLASGAAGATGAGKVALIAVGVTNDFLFSIAEGALSGKDLKRVAQGGAFKALSDPALDVAKEHFLEEHPKIAFPVMVITKLAIDVGFDKYTESEHKEAHTEGHKADADPDTAPGQSPFAKVAKANEEYIDRYVVMPAGPFCPA
jgi:hypothetical protein